ncbi:peptidylprolyl isomerase [Sphingomonas sp. NFR04]|uniref:peptidylprolyl isomerase n=1 Tax=Sphingomonas sp. NFR04 TaxID=1566283 RepID=UPI0008F0E2DC|nr:peptidylprolyl isomerase [Sphingomonas sp. NFR04]SFJ90829.1 peptidylprolyl isomerase [Sphingomonas sp. NFR04]
MAKTLLVLAATLAAAPLAAQTAPQSPTPSRPAPSAAEPAPEDWHDIPDDEILLIQLASGKQVAIRLAARFAPAHVANIRKLAAARWWDGESVYRVQENWVAQWGDPTEKKPLPPEILTRPPAEFEIGAFTPAQRLSKPDSYAAATGVTADGWPIASDGKAAWLSHCYGMVGVARDSLPDTGSGSELFTPIGQSARRLDRNYTVVGRIVEGMQYLSALPRSDAAMGVYATAAERTGIAWVRLASQLPPDERPHFQVRATDNARYAAMMALRENPAPPTIATGLNVCDLPAAIRRRP